MSASLKDYLRAPYRAVKARLFDNAEWRSRGYIAPSPRLVKNQVLRRNGLPSATWVETGTFMGETTSFLALHAKQVFSLEPADIFYARAARRFEGNPKVKIINGPSETVFPELLPTLRGPVNFWLDGHYSEGHTFQGEKDTPIVAELAEIGRSRAMLGEICVLVDDVRCFDPGIPKYAGYPPLDFLVDWAREQGLTWHIEHDIFVARSGTSV